MHTYAQQPGKKQVFFPVTSRLAIFLIVFVMLLFSGQFSLAQSDSLLSKGLKINLDKTGSKYLQFSITGQTWLRFNQNNPGSKLNEALKPASFDIGLRRVRIQMTGNLHERFFIYTQIGINNFNAVSARKTGIFFHDVALEYHAIKKYLTIGAGLTGWTGYLRYSSPAVASILEADAPLYQQATNDVNDQFLRKLSVYFKGKIKKLDYRLILSDPFILQTSATYDPAIAADAKFNPLGHSFQAGTYLSYELFEAENNVLPYHTGSYLGKKKVLNIGAGFQFQPDATWNLMNGTDTLYHPMLLAGADVFYDAPLGKSGKYALTLYGAYSYSDFGPGYLRNLAPMNPVNGLDVSSASLNGSGNGYPGVGTGHTGFLQAGLLLPSGWFGKNNIRLQPYASTQISAYDRLKDPMILLDAGLNVLWAGHHSKLSLHYQNRPVFDINTHNEIQRMSGALIQYQVFI